MFKNELKTLRQKNDDLQKKNDDLQKKTEMFENELKQMKNDNKKYKTIDNKKQDEVVEKMLDNNSDEAIEKKENDNNTNEAIEKKENDCQISSMLDSYVFDSGNPLLEEAEHHACIYLHITPGVNWKDLPPEIVDEYWKVVTKYINKHSGNVKSTTNIHPNSDSDTGNVSGPRSSTNSTSEESESSFASEVESDDQIF